MSEDTGIRPFQPLPDRLGALPVDETIYDGVPEWLDHPLRDWLRAVLEDENRTKVRGQRATENLARRVALRLRWARLSADQTYSSRLETAQQTELLTAIDAVLQLHSQWDRDTKYYFPRLFRGRLAQLEGILIDGRSLYRIDREGHCLVRRVDSTVQATVDAAITATTSTAADYLRTAWAAAYGISPDPDKAYDHAVLALEDLLCPLVCPRNNRATLGVVIRDLRSQAAQWQLSFEDTNTGQPASVDSVIQILDLLWKGQSRHAGNPNSRQQTQPEAEAAIHMAAALTQWLSAGVLHRKT